MWTILGVIVVAGLAGGAVSYALTRPERFEWKPLWWCLIPGIGAAFLIPLFLQMLSSSLLVELLRSDNDASRAQYVNNLLVFGGFCLLAAIFSRRFIENLSERVLSDLREAKQAATEGRLVAMQAKETAERVEADEMQARAAEDSQRLGLVRDDAATAAFIHAPAVLADIAPGPVPDDPWAGQFGGRAEANARRLEARIRPHPDYPEWCLIRLRVLSTDPKRAPLTGAVQFYLHRDSFANYRPIVPAVNGIAELTIAAWGAFTVGAVADGGNTLLELNLQHHPDAPEPFRSR